MTDQPTEILVAGTGAHAWVRLLAPLGRPQRVGGVYLFALGGAHEKLVRECPSGAGEALELRIVRRALERDGNVPE